MCMAARRAHTDAPFILINICKQSAISLLGAFWLYVVAKAKTVIKIVAPACRKRKRSPFYVVAQYKCREVILQLAVMRVNVGIKACNADASRKKFRYNFFHPPVYYPALIAGCRCPRNKIAIGIMVAVNHYLLWRSMPLRLPKKNVGGCPVNATDWAKYITRSRVIFWVKATEYKSLTIYFSGRRCTVRSVAPWHILLCAPKSKLRRNVKVAAG